MTKRSLLTWESFGRYSRIITIIMHDQRWPSTQRMTSDQKGSLSRSELMNTNHDIDATRRQHIITRSDVSHDPHLRYGAIWFIEHYLWTSIMYMMHYTTHTSWHDAPRQPRSWPWKVMLLISLRWGRMKELPIIEPRSLTSDGGMMIYLLKMTCNLSIAYMMA